MVGQGGQDGQESWSTEYEVPSETSRDIDDSDVLLRPRKEKKEWFIG
jgi:hypothetical protein